jgi:GNAT superfamily N-acetyltransferase
MKTVRLRHAVRADVPTIVDIWVDAFTDDPFLRWMQPDDAGWPAFGTAWLTFIAELCFERGHTYIADPADVAIAWIPPDLEFVTLADVERGRAIIEEHAGKARADGALATIVAARAHLPAEPHWTLQYIGVRRSRQGAGLGVAAAAPGLARCDNDALPCSLVSTNLRNVPFYERQGFRVAAESFTPDGAAAMRPMHRAARAAFTD